MRILNAIMSVTSTPEIKKSSEVLYLKEIYDFTLQFNNNIKVPPRKKAFYLQIFKNYFKGSAIDSDLTGDNFYLILRPWHKWKNTITKLVQHERYLYKEKLQLYFYGNIDLPYREIFTDEFKNSKYISYIEIYQIVDYSLKLDIIDLKKDQIVNSIDIIKNLKID